MFSPITERSRTVKALYLSIYGLLMLGGITMVVPFFVMASGSVEPFPQPGIQLVPWYLFSQPQMERRFVQVKYGGDADLVRASWDDPAFDFRDELPPAGRDEGAVEVWQEFLKAADPAPANFLLAFGPSQGMPSYSGRIFRKWLLERFGGDLARLNQSLGTDFSNAMAIVPPAVSLVSVPPGAGNFVDAFFRFLGERPDLRLAADAGGYYRSVFLPARFSGSVEAYNRKYGTAHASWKEIPFPATAPEAGREEWLFFASQLLRPDFVTLTPSGEAARAASGLPVREFIRTAASAPDLRVGTIDVQFEEWCRVRKGVAGARIPQRESDGMQLRSESGAWKLRFAALNYQRVADEMLLHGHAFTNTMILVVLFVAGALTVNPLAAYALSRFKFRQTYAILMFCLVTAAFPAEVLMIPVFLQLKEFHLLNTFGALVLPTLANGFSIFLLKGFFDSLPKELYEAAELDGAGEFVMFWQITMTLSKPILAVIALGAFNAAYGTFFYALILAPDPKLWTIMVYIFQLQSSAASPVVYASLLLASVPTVLVFIFCQKLILNGIVVPSEK